MRIILSVPGHLKTVPMNKYVYETLKEMGHDVKIFNFGVSGIYQRLLKKISRRGFFMQMNSRLKEITKTYRPDIFITIFGFDHDRETIEYIMGKGILTICWWLNDPFQFHRSIRQADFYNCYFTNAKGSVSLYKKEGIKNIFFLPLCCYPQVHKKIENIEKKYDISFAGDWHPVREEILNSLSADFNVAIFGPWGDKIKKGSMLKRNIVKNGGFTPSEMVKIFNQSKIVLNIHTWFGKWNCGINPRLFEANGCSAFQICDWKEEIPELYEVDREIVVYKTLDKLKEKIVFFLENADKRLEISNSAYLRTHRQHTYEARLKEMFSICKLN